MTEGGAYRFLIVTKHVVVREDLREMLQGTAGHQVDVVGRLGDVQAAPYDAVFLSAGADELISDPSVRDLIASGAKIVVMTGADRAGVVSAAGFTPLVQPFTTDDVLRVMRSLNLV
ncbi:MAG: hypothetical protein ACU0GG_04750 [Paracoccaceae bacterium]